MQTITINTQATDANGIAKAMSRSLEIALKEIRQVSATSSDDAGMVPTQLTLKSIWGKVAGFLRGLVN